MIDGVEGTAKVKCYMCTAKIRSAVVYSLREVISYIVKCCVRFEIRADVALALGVLEH